METLISISYWICGAGVVLCVLAYAFVPKALRMLMEEESETQDKE